MTRSWKFIGLLAVSYWLFAAPAAALPEIKPTFPRLANYFLHWTISEDEARDLSKYDLVILDAEVQERSRPQLELLRKLNPKIILLAYVPASEIRRDAASLGQIAPLRYKLGADVPDDWYVKDAAGNRLSFWPGTWIVSVRCSATENPLLSNGKCWKERLVQFATQEILSTELWDGVFYDNAWDDIVHFAQTVPDLDKDGVTDNAETARRAWQDGLRAIYRRTAELAPNYFVFENDGPMYAPEVHGVLLENFPAKGWERHKQDLQKVLKQARDPKVAVLNATTFNTGASDDYRAMRFGLATALVFDAHYSYDFGDQDHGQTWWYDEYEAFLGEAIGEARPLPRTGSPSAWQRDFENGIVFVNPSDSYFALKLPLEVEKIRGAQDPAINNGIITQQLTIDPKDGLIVLRPLDRILGAVYENGVFARVFDAQGQTARAGFFAYDKTEKSGAVIAVADLDGDQKNDKIKLSSDGLVKVVFSNGESVSFYPFGNNWKGQISVDIGDVNHDGVLEIVAASGGQSLPRKGLSSSQVRIYRPNGTLISLPFFPFGINYKGGINVAVGDLNGDGFSEIVLGAGSGGGPQVRIFSGEGRLLSGGFFAYDPRFRGGVQVAVGDTDGDGNAEIITGPGVGGGPQIRIFNNKGQPLSAGFFAFDRASRAGVIPIVADVNKDGKNEILTVQ